MQDVLLSQTSLSTSTSINQLLSYYFVWLLKPKQNPIRFSHRVKDGASGRIRTSDRSVRSRVLYPAELRMHNLKWR